MIRFEGRIEYLDGRVEDWHAGGAIQAEWESYADRHGLPLVPTTETLPRFPLKRWQLFLAYASLDLEEGFDTWRKTVLDVEMKEEPGLVPPILPDRFAALDSSSPS
jgi:hypothetical protein